MISLMYMHEHTAVDHCIPGPGTKVMRKAKMSFQSGQVKQVLRAYAIEVQTSDKKELDIDAVTLRLRRAMGANCTILHHLKIL